MTLTCATNCLGPFASSWVAMQGAYREETQMEVNRFDRSDGKI